MMSFNDGGNDGGGNNIALINVSMNILKYNLFHYGNEHDNANTHTASILNGRKIVQFKCHLLYAYYNKMLYGYVSIE